MKKITLIIILCISACVAPPDYSDGLLENIPAVVNKGDYFSVSILGDKFSETHDWPLALNVEMSDTLFTTMAITDLDIGEADSSFLFMMNGNGDTVFTALLISNLVWATDVPVETIGEPKTISFIGDKFTGNFDFQLLKK